MKTDLDTLLTALYVYVDDHGLATRPKQPGRPKKLTDAELVCLAVAQVLLGYPWQHHWLRACYGRLGHLFPYLPKQPGYSKRIKAAGPLIATLLAQFGAQTSATSDEFRFIDATPVPCGTSVPTRKRSDLAGFANYGYCAWLSRWYWGVKLYLITTAHGMPVAWCLADPKLGEREVGIELIGRARDHHALPHNCVLIGDKGFSGKNFEQPRRHPPTHRIRLRHLQRPTLPPSPPRPHPRRALRPHRPTTPRPGRRHLAQPKHQRTDHPLTDRLRPLS